MSLVIRETFFFFFLSNKDEEFIPQFRLFVCLFCLDVVSSVLLIFFILELKPFGTIGLSGAADKFPLSVESPLAPWLVVEECRAASTKLWEQIGRQGKAPGDNIFNRCH